MRDDWEGETVASRDADFGRVGCQVSLDARGDGRVDLANPAGLQPGPLAESRGPEGHQPPPLVALKDRSDSPGPSSPDDWMPASSQTQLDPEPAT